MCYAFLFLIVKAYGKEYPKDMNPKDVVAPHGMGSSSEDDGVSAVANSKEAQVSVIIVFLWGFLNCINDKCWGILEKFFF